MKKHTFLGILVITLAAITWWLASESPRVQAADGVVGNGTSGSCSEAAFDAVFNNVQATGGGTVTFNCAPSDVPIVFSTAKFPSAPTTVDGDGVITLSGGNSTQLFLVFAGKSLTLTNIILTNGSSGAAKGGALFNNGGTLTLINTTVQNSQSNTSGGAIYTRGGTATLINSTVQGNTSPLGAIDTDAWLNLYSTVVRNNISSNGGGLYLNGTTTISRSQIYNNQSTGYNGGGIYIASGASATIIDSRINNNTASGFSVLEGGGGIWNNGTLVLQNSVVDHNSGYEGGGILNVSASDATIVNSTISGNNAADGGGLDDINATVFITYSTIAFNTATQSSKAGGISAVLGGTYLKDTIISNNGAVACFNAGNTSLFSNGYNLSDQTCSLWATGDRRNVNPLLGPLADNGGPTLTHMPQAISPGIDAGQCILGITNDQRGGSRPIGVSCDIGAVEYGASLPRLRLPLIMR